ncbi:hypothetical protein GCM10008023_15120 [Sphingomonas glacialis]|uniref:MAPEG family protein n=2 Tax=Sphingomonas glacialis TaxID=658225 RepID=A0ABQ3LH24_9SPHN|nr:hypothetical protein GCM10008023_15120 [Sphingomonas glacialis]
MIWDAYIRPAIVAAELLMGLTLLVYRPVSVRDAPDDPDAAHDYVERKRRNRRYVALYVLFLGAVQIPVLLSHSS